MPPRGLCRVNLLDAASTLLSIGRSTPMCRGRQTPKRTCVPSAAARILRMRADTRHTSQGCCQKTESLQLHVTKAMSFTLGCVPQLGSGGQGRDQLRQPRQGQEHQDSQQADLAHARKRSYWRRATLVWWVGAVWPGCAFRAAMASMQLVIHVEAMVLHREINREHREVHRH